MMSRSSLLLSASLALAACSATPARDVPALLVNPSAAARAELSTVVRTALRIPQVTLADDALVNRATLFIDRAAPRDAGGARLTGRDTTQPEVFHLRLRGRECVLLHESSNEAYPLQAARCTPAHE